MTGPSARPVASRGCAPAQARRAGPVPCRAGQPAVLGPRTAFPGCVELAALSWWLLAASLAPVCVRCHHAGCVITGRIRTPAGAILAAALIATGQPPALTRGTAASRPSGPTAGHQRPRTEKGSHRDGRHRQPGRTPVRGHEQGRRPASGSAGAPPGSATRKVPGARAAAAVALAGCRRGSCNLRDASSPPQATRSGRGHSATEQISQGG